MIVLEDESGIKINFKKTNLDLEKTTAVNELKEPSPAPAPAPAEEPAKAEEKPAQAKKATRKYTERDIYRLRSKSPFEEESESEGGEEETEDKRDAKTEEKTEEYWRETSQEMLSAVKQAEAAYRELSAGCQKLQGATIQTHRVYNSSTGETLDMQETTQSVCQEAEQAKAALDDAKSSYDAFVQEAREEVVPPGWIASDEE
jgi:hypothetical protein